MRDKNPLFGPNATGLTQGQFPPRAGAKLDDHGNPMRGPLDAVTPIHPDDLERIRATYQWPVPVVLPRTAHPPEGARTIDFRRQITVAAGASGVQLLNFQAIAGSTTVFYRYGLILPAGGAPAVFWSPNVDGRRVLQYHGDPGALQSSNPATSLNVSTGEDFSDVSLAQCQLILQPGEVFQWLVSNTTANPVVMGVRLVGYMDTSQQLLSSKLGD